MWLVSTLYERNLFYQQLNLKYQMLIFIRSKIWRLRGGSSERIGAPSLMLIWIYFLDIILGMAMLVAILFYPTLKIQIEDLLSLYTLKMLDLVDDYLSWIMGVPLGIKLNTPVSHFLGSHYLYVLRFWRLFYMEFIAIYMSSIVKFLVLLLPFGLSLALTALHDFLKFLNLCLICFFVISHRISTLQISALKSLGRLFMGKKWNILKDRVDTCHYDLNQLLVGTLIFTILLFLVPTTGMYTLVFLYLRVLQFSVQLVLRLCVVFINKVTLFFILNFYALLVKEPITRAKFLIQNKEPLAFTQKDSSCSSGSERGRNNNLNVFKFDESHVVVSWNGMNMSVLQMKEIMKSTPKEEIVQQLQPGFQCSLDGGPVEQQLLSHSMLKWIWPLSR